MTEQPVSREVAAELHKLARPASAFDLAVIVRQYESPLLRYALSLLRGRHDQAQDLVQDAFIRLHRQVDEKGSASILDMTSWLYRVVHNLSVDAARKRKSRDNAESAPRPTNETESTLGSMIKREACRTAMTELDRLDEPQRQLIMLKVIEGLTLRQISEVTGMSVGNANYHLSRGMKELSRRMRVQEAI